MYPCPQSRTVILTGSGDACWRRRWEVIFINIILTPKSLVLSGFVCCQDYFDCYTYIVVPMIWSETRRLNSHHVCSASFRQTLIQAQFLLQFRRQAIFIFCMEIGECYISSLKVINKNVLLLSNKWTWFLYYTTVFCYIISLNGPLPACTSISALWRSADVPSYTHPQIDRPIR